MLVTLLPMVMLAKLVQKENAEFPMRATAWTLHDGRLAQRK